MRIRVTKTHRRIILRISNLRCRKPVNVAQMVPWARDGAGCVLCVKLLSWSGVPCLLGLVLPIFPWEADVPWYTLLYCERI